MEHCKRKRGSDGENGRPRRPPPPSSRKSPSEAEGRNVTDDEVEEFFAILRRMHEIFRDLAAGTRAKPTATATAGGANDNAAVSRWSPALAWEDFAGGPWDAVKDEEGRRSNIHEDGPPGAPSLSSTSPATAAAEDGETVAVRLLDLNAFPDEHEGFRGAESSR